MGLPTVKIKLDYFLIMSPLLHEATFCNHSSVRAFGFFTIKKSDAFLSEYLIDLKLHRTK